MPKEEVTKRGRPRLRPRGLSGKTIRTIVLDMAKGHIIPTVVEMIISHSFV